MQTCIHMLSHKLSSITPNAFEHPPAHAYRQLAAQLLHTNKLKQMHDTLTNRHAHACTYTHRALNSPSCSCPQPSCSTATAHKRAGAAIASKPQHMLTNIQHRALKAPSFFCPQRQRAKLLRHTNRQRQQPQLQQQWQWLNKQQCRR